MDLKAMMMEYLQNEGFRPEATDYGLDFKCEGKNFVFFNDEDDEQYFRLMMPNIFDVTDENRDFVLRALNIINTEIKVIKAYTPVPDSIWIGFEVLVDSTPILGDLVPRAIGMLNAGQKRFYEAIESGE